MTFEQYWAALEAKNPGLRDPANKMTISVESFKRSMRQSFKEGQGSELREDIRTLNSLFGG